MAFTSSHSRTFDAYARAVRPALLQQAGQAVGFDNAEDIVQRVLGVAWEIAGRFDFSNPKLGPTDFFYFLRPLMRSAIADHFRALERRNEVLLPIEEVLALAERGAHPEVSEQIWQIHREQLYALLERTTLTTKQEMCIRMWLEHLTQSQICAYMGISQQSVCEHIKAATQKMRGSAESPEAADILEVYEEEAEATIYRKPYDIWDRRGTSQQIDARRYKEPCTNIWSKSR